MPLLHKRHSQDRTEEAALHEAYSLDPVPNLQEMGTIATMEALLRHEIRGHFESFKLGDLLT